MKSHGTGSNEEFDDSHTYCRHSITEIYRTAAERKKVSGSGCGIDTTAAQTSALLLWGVCEQV